jgi:hypothetical protein
MKEFSLRTEELVPSTESLAVMTRAVVLMKYLLDLATVLQQM